MLFRLPPELLLSILKYLSLSDLAACVSSCRTFKTFIDEYESTVYRQAAAHPSLRLIPHDEMLFSDILSLGLLSKRFLGEAKTWKELCKCLLVKMLCCLNESLKVTEPVTSE